MALRFCKVCRDFHDLDQPWPDACNAHFMGVSSASIQIIKDIEPYKAAAVDVATGKRPQISSRSDHREFLKRNKYIEVGNEPIKQRAWDFGKEITPRDVRQTYEKLKDERR